MISRARNFIYIHIQKTGGTSIQQALLPYADDVMHLDSASFQDGIERFELTLPGTMLKKHSLMRDYIVALDKNFFESATKFTVIRNPWDRAISVFFFHEHYLRKPLSQGTTDGASELSFDAGKFEEHLRFAYRLRRHVCPWSDGKPMPLTAHRIDQFLRFETLQSDFDKISSAIGLPKLTLAHRNQSAHRHYSEYYTPRLRKLIRDKFAEEIEMFGFKFAEDGA